MAVILLAEDDFYLRRDLGLMLKEEGCSILAAGSVREAMQYILSRNDIDLYLLDLWLPDGDAFTLLSKIRERSTAPVLFLTACDDEQSVIRSLESGADDYVTKPFRKAELLSRIHANLRRSAVSRGTTVLVSGDLKLDPFRHEVKLKDELLPLRPAEFRLLQLFMENPGLLFSRERLLDALSENDPESLAEDNALSVQISRLRKVLPLDYIETVRGFGYRFAPEVRRQ